MTDANASRASSDTSTVGSSPASTLNSTPTPASTSTPTSTSAPTSLPIPPTVSTSHASTGAGSTSSPSSTPGTTPSPSSPPPPYPGRPGGFDGASGTRTNGGNGSGSGFGGSGGTGSRNGASKTGVLALWLVLVLTIAGAAAGGYWLNKRLDDNSASLAARQSRDDAALAQTQFKSDQSLGAVHQLDNQVAALTGKVSDTQTQQQALQQLYQDLARNRDDWVMTDAEQTLSTANQQLQLTGNTQLALYALQNADTQLATTDAPQVVEIRRAVAADIAKLQAAPALDVPGLALRLDQVIKQVDSLPMAGDLPPADTAANAVAASSASAAQGAQTNAPHASIFTKVYWQQWWARMTHHYGDAAQRLVQVRRIDHSTTDAMMVAPSQAEYLRENIKLRLLSARLSLLSRNETLLQSDLDAADATLAQYFDPSSPATQRVRTTLADVRRAAQQVSIPTLDASLQALRQYKPRS